MHLTEPATDPIDAVPGDFLVVIPPDGETVYARIHEVFWDMVKIEAAVFDDIVVLLWLSSAELDETFTQWLVTSEADAEDHPSNDN
jgi:hypothetical protein